MSDRLSQDLYAEEGSRSQRFVSVSIDEDGLCLETQDLGPAVEDFWGDSDYEF